VTVVLGPILLPERPVHVRVGGPNPGIGGTENTAIQLALRLAEETTLSIELVIIGGPIVVDSHSALAVTQARTFDEFSPRPDDVLIAPVSTLLKVHSGRYGEAKIVAWSHHPHDSGLRAVSRLHHPAAVVSNSRYSYWSNNGITRAHFFFRNPLAPTAVLEQVKDLRHQSPVRLGHVSSLHPAKGFLHIARQWHRIRKVAPGASLEIAGGLSLYGEAESHPSLPVQYQHGEDIMTAFGGSIPPEVRFLGVVSDGLDDIIQGWDAAILNPTGVSETDPASVKDCLRNGVPVVGGRDFGMAELLESFPELSIRRPSDIAGVVSELQADPMLRHRLAARSLEAARALQADDRELTRRWVEFIEAVLEGSAAASALAARRTPGRLPYALEARLRRRRALEPVTTLAAERLRPLYRGLRRRLPGPRTATRMGT
jgi:glycosyltransferase involved in cell wall biosynthesis